MGKFIGLKRRPLRIILGGILVSVDINVWLGKFVIVYLNITWLLRKRNYIPSYMSDWCHLYWKLTSSPFTFNL